MKIILWLVVKTTRGTVLKGLGVEKIDNHWFKTICWLTILEVAIYDCLAPLFPGP